MKKRTAYRIMNIEHRKSKWFTSTLVILSLLFIILSLNSCFKEKPLPPPSNQNIGETAVIEMGPDYTNQFWYSLETNSVIASNSRYAYDLLFDCEDNRFYIWLNSAKFMSVIRTDKTNLDSVSVADTTNGNWLYELGEFNTDSNTFGKWWDTLSAAPHSQGKVYIVSMGMTTTGASLGFIKMKVNDYSDYCYSITFSNLDGSNLHTTQIKKNNTRNYAYFNFVNNTVVNNIEPDKTTWDMCFTRYNVIFYEPYYLPYSVVGVLHNPYNTSAYLDSTINADLHHFDSIDIHDFNFSKLETRRDAVGYDWKRYELGDYTMKPHYTYFIKCSDNRFYKFHFVSFKSTTGIWGYPTFEFYKL